MLLRILEIDRALCVPYHDFALAIASQSLSKIQEEYARHREVFREHGNLGLATSLLRGLLGHRLVLDQNIYSRIRVQDLDKRHSAYYAFHNLVSDEQQGNNVKSLEDHLLSLIEMKAVKGSLSHRDGHVLSFHETVVNTNVNSLDIPLQELQKRGRWLEDMNRKLSLSDAYLSRQTTGGASGEGLGKKRGSYVGQGDLIHDEIEETEDLMLIHSS